MRNIEFIIISSSIRIVKPIIPHQTKPNKPNRTQVESVMLTGKDYKQQTELTNKIIQLLEKENCTVREAKAVLNRVSRTIDGTSTVQFVEGLDYEF